MSCLWLQPIGCTQSHDHKTAIKHVGFIPLISNRPMNLTHTCEVFLMHLSCQKPHFLQYKIYMITLLLNLRILVLNGCFNL